MKSDRVSFSLLIAALALGLASAGCGVECRPRTSTVCQAGITYWVDSCGERQDDDDYQVCQCGCDALGEVCEDCNCIPNCDGRECGPDGCGGQCGPGCDANQICESGQCRACQPDCAERECGPDGCGGQCGIGCGRGQTCTEEGLCEDCQPDCAGRQCGPDGCGGQCGPGCAPGETCLDDGQCQACQPDCEGRQCGPDGCGGQCDPGCGDGEACDNDGQCQSVACGEGVEPSVSGAFTTDVAPVPFDRAQVTVTHKRDVDEWEDGCITSVQIDLGYSDGCTLSVLASDRFTSDGGLEIQSVTFSADSFCPNFPDATEGTYTDSGGLQQSELVLGVTEVPGYNLAESCVATSFSLLLQGGLARTGDGEPLQITASQITVSGEFVSTGDPASQCPCRPQCDGLDCGDDGCGGECGTCENSQYCVDPGVCQAASATTCWTGDGFRTKRTPQAGDLMVTEVMADPANATDANGEWFEIWVRRDLDLNGLSWGQDEASASVAFAEGDCLEVAAGSLLLVAKGDDPQLNGGLPAPDALLPFNLLNANGGIYLGFYDQTVDQVSWAQTQSGVSRSLDPAAIVPDLNDDPVFWCAAGASYGQGDLGTPAEANPGCGLAELTCTDGGAPRLKVAPQAGDLVISEFMADPTWVPDADGEWLEVTVLAEVDLNGLSLGRDDFLTQVVPEGDCLRVPAGTRLLFARDPDPAVNGELPAVDGVFEFNLLNAGGWIAVGLYDEVLDLVSYEAVEAGVANSLDPDRVDAALNDSAANWCPAVTIYNAGDDLGTPADPNPQCP